MRREGKQNLLSPFEVDPSRDEIGSSPAIQRALLQLIAETAGENHLAVTSVMKKKARLTRVFTTLEGFFAHIASDGSNPYSAKEKLVLRLQSPMMRGVTENIYNQQRKVWLPVVYIKRSQLGGRDEFAPALLHELKHAAEHIVVKEKHPKRYSVRAIGLAFIALVTSLSGELLLVRERLHSQSAETALVVSVVFSLIVGLGEIGAYYFDPEEVRARKAAKRVGD